MRVRWRARILIAIASALLPAIASAAKQPPSDSSPPTESSPAVERVQIERLIEQLGSDTFQQREAATRQLRRLGSDAIEQLESGLRHPDPEIQARCTLLLDQLYRLQHRQLLEAFRKDPTAAPGNQLPGWKAMQSLCGDTEESRGLLIAMHETEPLLFTTWASGNESKLATLILRRCVEVQEKYRGSGRREANLHSVTALLFLASVRQSSEDPRPLALPDTTVNLLNSLLYYNNIRTELADGKLKVQLRKLLSVWVGHAHSATNSYTKLLIAMRYNLPEGVKPAEAMIKAKVSGLQLQYALLAIGKLGSTAQLDLVTRSFLDRTVLSQSVGKGKVQYRCEVRDVALAVAVHLTGQSVENYGFKRLRKNSVYLYSPNSAGFESEETRNTAFGQWTKWTERNQKDD